MFENVNGGELRQTVSEDFNAEGTGSLKDFVGKEGICHGFIFKKTDFGMMTMLALTIDNKNLFVGIPSRYTDTFKQLTDEEVNAMVSKGVAIKNIKAVKTKKGQDTVLFNLVV